MNIYFFYFLREFGIRFNWFGKKMKIIIIFILIRFLWVEFGEKFKRKKENGGDRY